MFRRFAWLAAALVALAMLPSPAHAQRGRYNNTPAQSLYGPIFNPTMTPEYRQAGGNPEVYQQLVEQKMMMQQQKEYLAYQKQVAANQKQMAAYLKANPKAKQQLEDQQKANEAAWKKEQEIYFPTPHARKKKTQKSSTTAANSPVAGAPTQPSVAKPNSSTK